MGMHLRTWTVYLPLLALGPVARAIQLSPDNPRIRYFGRHAVNATVATFDWVGSGLMIALSDTGAANDTADADDTGNTDDADNADNS